MAIYHLEAKVVSRGTGRSAVAASAYLSCSRLYNDYDGIQHDYTRKQGLVWQQVFLPEYAPQEWQDREKLWNAVEEVETAKDSRLAREFVVALPIELNREEQIELLQEFVREQFVADGMCADAAIHDTDGHNPHAHILLTVRPLDERGKWQYKTEKEYLCMKNGEERGFTAAEFKVAQNEGWEKQYPYKVGKKKVYMTPSAAETQGLVRADKHPKSTRYGRQNPISERWNSEEQLAAWRAAWADVSNRYLERAGREERIDHRSNAARGLDEIPTIHEGAAAQALERKGIISDRCEINRQIKADNTLLRELKAEIKKLAALVARTVPAIADAPATGPNAACRPLLARLRHPPWCRLPSGPATPRREQKNPPANLRPFRAKAALPAADAPAPFPATVQEQPDLPGRPFQDGSCIASFSESSLAREWDCRKQPDLQQASLCCPIPRPPIAVSTPQQPQA